MPRKPFVPTKNPYHVSARCINKDWFSQPLEELWPLFCDYLYLTKIIHDVKIHSFVLMDNHFHLLITAPNLNLSEAMAFFLRETSRNILKVSGRLNRTYSSRFFRCEIKSFHHFMTAYKYVYRNPVEAGIVDSCEQYKFSTLNGIIGTNRLLVPLEEDTLADIYRIEDQLSWLNTRPDPDHQKAVKNALRRPQFKLPKRNGRPHILETDKF